VWWGAGRSVGLCDGQLWFVERCAAFSPALVGFIRQGFCVMDGHFRVGRGDLYGLSGNFGELIVTS